MSLKHATLNYAWPGDFLVLLRLAHVIACDSPPFLLELQAFVIPTLPSSASVSPLMASRVNAKKEKIKRNRDNMRKFKSVGRKGTSRRKMLKKAQASKARQTEAEFIAQCYITAPPPNSVEEPKQ
jgi:hypothetical protein